VSDHARLYSDETDPASAQIALPDSSSHAVETVLPCRLRIVISSTTKSQTPVTTSAASPAESLEQVQLLLATRTSARAESSRGGATAYKPAGILRSASVISAAVFASIPWSLTHPAEHGDAETGRCHELLFEGELLLAGVPTFTAPNVAVSVRRKNLSAGLLDTDLLRAPLSTPYVCGSTLLDS
jgi:hypothetical protein